MGILLDLHVHTNRHSPCSKIAPELLVRQAAKTGLDGVVLTEHHYQWEDAALQELVCQAGEPGFVLLAGFEYASTQGDFLVYGLTPQQSRQFEPGWPPERVALETHAHGGVCVAAHPTRPGMGFDERIFTLGVDAVEVCSVNLRDHERRLAANIAKAANKPPIAASDAHLLHDVGRFMTEFLDPIRTRDDLQDSLRRGRFRLLDGLWKEIAS